MISTREKILHLLKTTDLISGEEIAETLNLSRTAVWKHIQNLKSKGYHVQSIKHKGYRLTSTPDLPIQEEITNNIQTRIIGKRIHYFESLASTNSYAKTMVNKENIEGTIIIAARQTKGRGRKNRIWDSQQGGLYFSIILNPSVAPQHAMIVTMAASIAITNAIANVTGLQSFIKWPNDILIDGKKVCGILTELDAELDVIHYMILGIGINVNNDIDPLLESTATSLKAKSQSSISHVTLLREILKNFDVLYDQVNQKKYESIKNQWIENTDLIGKKIQVKKIRHTIEGIVLGITETGSLMLHTTSGEKQIITGDIEYL